MSRAAVSIRQRSACYDRSRLQFAKNIVEVTAEPHTGCAKFVERFGLDAMKFVNSSLGRQLHLRGINAKVVQRGVIRVGDVVRKILVAGCY